MRLWIALAVAAISAHAAGCSKACAPNAPAAASPSGAIDASPSTGLFSRPIEVTLECAREGCEIGYTVDGSRPTAASARYAAPIEIGGTTVVRVAEIVRGRVVFDRASFTYVFPEDVVRQRGMSRALADDPKASAAIRASLSLLPIVAITAGKDALEGRSGVLLQKDGRKRRQPAFIEMVEPMGRVLIRVPVAIVPHSRLGKKRSLRLLFTGPRAAGPITAAVFGERETFRRLLLRGGANDAFFGDLGGEATYTRDQWVRDTQRAMSGFGARGRFVHLFLDGRYFGLYNLVEWPGRELAARQLGGQPKDWGIVRHRVERSAEANEEVGALRQLIAMNDSAGLAKRIDPELFFDYLILEWYAGVGDGLDNNWIGLHRPARSDREGWPLRFLTWDSEYMFVDAKPNPPSNHGAWVQPAFLEGSEESKRFGRTLMVGAFRTFMTDPELRSLLWDRARHHTSEGELTDERSIARWRSLNDGIRGAIIAESARWGGLEAGTEGWERAVETTQHRMKGNAERLIAALRAAGLSPDLDRAPPR